MRVITRAADRMLTAFVPRITADAGCTPKTWKAFCYCLEVGGEYYNEYYQTCTTSGACETYCGSCYVTGVCN
jgi:hypothetical protein